MIVEEQKIEATETKPEFLCPTHLIRLVYVLKGGCGFCTICNQYIQAAGIEAPKLDRSPRETKPKAKPKRRKRSAPASGRRGLSIKRQTTRSK